MCAYVSVCMCVCPCRLCVPVSVNVYICVCMFVYVQLRADDSGPPHPGQVGFVSGNTAWYEFDQNSVVSLVKQTDNTLWELIQFHRGIL